MAMYELRKEMRYVLVVVLLLGFSGSQINAQSIKPIVDESVNNQEDSDRRRLATENGLVGKGRDRVTQKIRIVPESEADAFGLQEKVPFNSSLYSRLLRSPAIRSELEISDSQFLEISKKKTAGEKAYIELAKRYEKALPEQKKDIEDAAKQLVKELEADIKEEILPHQLKALDTFLYRGVLQRRGLLASLSSGLISEKLDITDSQKEEMAEKAKNLHKEILAKTLDLQKKAIKSLLGELTSTQKKEFERILGKDPLQIERPDISRLLGELKLVEACLSCKKNQD